MAELAIADAYFKQETYAEAQVAYQSFKDLHPKHPKIDYVTYRLALSFYNQLPPTIDRDLSLAQSTILYCDEVINQYPNSEFVKDANDKKQATLKMLAGKEDYIAEFYFIREKYDSALTRYEGLLKKYPGLGYDAKALSGAAISATKVGEPDKARKYLAELQRKFPGSDELAAAKKEIH
jgi:outer membrane protein assembly factor BamD